MFFLHLRKLVLEVKQIVSHLCESSQGSTQCDLSAEITGTCNIIISLSVAIHFTGFFSGYKYSVMNLVFNA